MDRILTLEYRWDNGPPRFVIEGASAEQMWPDERDRTLDSGNFAMLPTLLRDFHGAVFELRRRMQGSLDWTGVENKVWTFLDKLHASGTMFWNMLLGREPSAWLERLNHLLTMHLPDQWWLQKPGPDPANLFEIQVKGPCGSLLPLDLLPFGTTKTRLYGGAEDLRAMAALFGGFVARVRYDHAYVGSHLRPTSSADRVLLDIRSISAPEVGAMEARLKTIGSKVCGPYPSRIAYTAPDDIARSFSIPEATPVEGAVPDVVHVFSHGYKWDEPARLLLLEFDYEQSEKVVVDGAHIRNARQDAVKCNALGPIVFLNSCHSLGHVGWECVSSALQLVESGTRAVLGVRDEIPASVAVEMSSNILTSMESSAVSVGAAAVNARWQLLSDRANPLGILYATFGDIDATRPDVTARED